MIIRNPLDRELFNRKVDPKEYPYNLDYSPYQPEKSNEQRAFFHKLLRILGDDIGIKEWDMKQIVLAKMFGTRPATLGGLVIVVPDTPYASSEKIPKKLYSDLIEIVYELGSEAGIVLPEAEK